MKTVTATLVSLGLGVLAAADDGGVSAIEIDRKTIVAEHDDMKGITFRNIKAYTCENGGECPALSSRTPVAFYYGIKGKTKLPLRMQLEYVGRDWVSATKMTFLVDGKRYLFAIPYFEWHRDVWSGGEVHETVDVPISTRSAPVTRALCNAKAVKVRFEGDHAAEDYVLEDWQVQALRLMCADWREPWSVYEARRKKEAAEAERAAKLAEQERLAEEAKRAKEAAALEADRNANLPELPAKIIAACREFRACMNSDDRTCYQRTFDPYEAACQEYERLEGQRPHLCSNKSNDVCAW